MSRLPYPQNKWKQAKRLSQHRLTFNHIPATQMAKIPSIRVFLRQYPIVYLKPRGGGQGRNIIRVDRIGRNATFRVRIQGGQNRKLKGLPATLRYLYRRVKYTPYVVQQGIHSVTSQGLPFDIRVHVQWVHGQWVIGGMVGKVAQPNQIVTNRHRGATPTMMDHLLTHHLGYNPLQKQAVISQLQGISLRTAALMRQEYPGWRTFGVDFGLDKNGKAWIYEVNIYPGIHVFRELPDPRPYQNILYNRKKRQGY